jgi:hypothetical protein
MSVGEILPNPGTVTTPTITAYRTNKIKTSSANELTSAVPIVGTRDAGQQSVDVVAVSGRAADGTQGVAGSPVRMLR